MNQPPMPPLPPNNAEAEQSVLGAMLLGGNPAVDRAAALLSPEDFYHRRTHGEIFGAMLKMAIAGEPVDAVTLRNELKNQGILEQVGGVAYLIQLADTEFTTSNLAHYAAIVSQKAIERRAIEACVTIAQNAYSGDMPIDDFVSDAESRIFALRPENGMEESGASLQVLLSREADAIKERKEAALLGKPLGLSTGFHGLDYLFGGGLYPNRFYLIAAPPGVGKSALVTNIANHVLTVPMQADGRLPVPGFAPKHVLIFSIEMDGQEVGQRMVCAEGRINSRKLSMGQMEESDMERYWKAFNRLQYGKCHIDYNEEVTPAYMEAVTRRVTSEWKHKPDLVILDYLQLMEVGGGGARPMNEQDELRFLSRFLKKYSRRYQVPLIVLAQMNRNAGKRDNKRPQLSDLHGSSSLEKNADMVAFLYDAAFFGDDENRAVDVNENENDDAVSDIDFIVEKQRQGPRGSITMGFQRAYTKFCSVDNRHEE